MRTALFWVIAQREMVISYWHFRTTYWSHIQGYHTASSGNFFVFLMTAFHWQEGNRHI